ncbi:spore germination protein [Bacillus sp. X1(2014)]|uniref:spore germination protein n=1 Tax=Bacillus sp. X1(2014) TaxID=1565991 RepID=UPI0011A8BBBF|nr:spore germination protein [Bacillus sp. X1(2014)]
MFFISPMVINVLGVKINSLDNGAVANTGSLQVIDQFVTYKRNQAFGEVLGDLSPVNLSSNTVIDPDVSDSNAVKNSVV